MGEMTTYHWENIKYMHSFYLVLLHMGRYGSGRDGTQHKLTLHYTILNMCFLGEGFIFTGAHFLNCFDRDILRDFF